MNFRVAATALAVLIATPGIAQAEEIARDTVVMSSDGKAVGKVNRVLTSGDDVTAIQLIVGTKMVTLSRSEFKVENGVVQSVLSKREMARR